ncbi:unnamed protein product [Amoebophrya sp. A120]|nr:unnamed protein product [Amoebophrya sp. A120]|eukprot:GSA120T00010654001.1
MTYYVPPPTHDDETTEMNGPRCLARYRDRGRKKSVVLCKTQRVVVHAKQNGCFRFSVTSEAAATDRACNIPRTTTSHSTGVLQMSSQRSPQGYRYPRGAREAPITERRTQEGFSLTGLM